MTEDRPVIEVSLPITLRQVSERAGVDTTSVIRSLWRDHRLARTPGSWLDVAELALIAEDFGLRIRMVK